MYAEEQFIHFVCFFLYVYVLALRIYTAVTESALMIAGISNYKAENYGIHSLHIHSYKFSVEIVLYFFYYNFHEKEICRVNNKFNNLGYITRFTKAKTAGRLRD